MMTKARKAMTLVEVVVLGAVGLMVVGVVVGLLSAAWRQDAWTSGRLDAMTACAATLENLRLDLYHADAAQTDPARGLLALRVNRPGARGPEVALYSLPPGKSLTRNGHALGSAHPAAFGVKVEDQTAVFELAVPAGAATANRETTLTVPLVIPDAEWAETCKYWAPAVN